MAMLRPSTHPKSRSRCRKAATHGLVVESVAAPRSPIVDSFAGCCARATGGHTGAAECDRQFPPSDGDCHAPRPCEGAYTNNTTPPACRLYVQGAQDAAAVHWRP